MARLILTEKEKNSATYLEWSDEALGQAVKKLALSIQDNKGNDSIAQTACATLLACMAAEKGVNQTMITLEGVNEGLEEYGDWQINISRCTTSSEDTKQRPLDPLRLVSGH